MNAAVLVARLYFGLGLAAHGAQKLFGWFGGYGIARTAGFMESLGFRPGRAFALAAGLGETLAGLLVATGLFGAAGPALMLLVMLVAAGSVHAKNGFFSMRNGVELPLLYGAAGMLLAFTGFGTLSLDRLLGLRILAGEPAAAIALVAAAAGALANLAARHAPEHAAAS